MWCKERTNSQSCPLSSTQESAHMHTLTHAWTQTDKKKRGRGAQGSPHMLLNLLYLLPETPTLQLPGPHPRFRHELESLQLSSLSRLNSQCHLGIMTSEEGKFCQVTKDHFPSRGCRHFLWFPPLAPRAKEEAPGQSKSLTARVSNTLALAVWGSTWCLLASA